MKSILSLLLLIFAVHARAESATNSIDALVERLNSSNGLWMNGPFPILPLSSNATPKEVVASAVQKWGFDRGHIETYQVLEVRQVPLRYYMTNSTAVLIESNLGRKILLAQYQGERWWTRFFDVPERTAPGGSTNESQRIRSETNSTPSAAGSHR